MSIKMNSRMADEIHTECVAYLRNNPSFVFCEEPEASKRVSLVEEIEVICRRFRAEPRNITFSLTMPMGSPAGHTFHTVTLRFLWGDVEIDIESPA